MKRMKNVVPYVVMVTGLTAIFVWSKWRQAENREVRAVSVVTPAPAADGIMLIDVRTPEGIPCQTQRRRSKYPRG